MFSFLGLALLLASPLALAAPLNSTTSRPISAWDAKHEEQELLLRFSKVADPPASYKVAFAAVSVTGISTTQASSYAPYTHLAAASYCATSALSTWKCGQHCTALPGMIVYAAGGNNGDTPDWFVGYFPSLASAVVVHQGTTPSNFESDYIDIDFFKTTLSSTYFPGLSSSVEVHNGFAAAHLRTAPAVLAAVKRIMSDHGVKKVTCVGHSLGGAISILDAISLQLTLPAGTSFKVVTYGQPRVGNQAFADYIDSHISDNHRITHSADVVPIVPGRFLGFAHSAGEKHIDPSSAWWACSGQDNTSNPQCSTGQVGSIFSGSTTDHHGPYDDGLVMDC